MSETTAERQNLIEVVNALLDEALVELANFLDYLRYKTAQGKELNASQQNFLLSLAGLGKSEQQDVSESDEAILRTEIDPVYGWSNRLNEHS
ncbi:hypothetical protein [Leptolyngbya ohadii]|uniref:hypothetical protein n=1 Tax=Leptolyngbya ohadii TaxID=1962290 RepID=UPI000B598FD3|nr:hypothetical protein [Leptolyngbya ohadii]